ncbi:MAG TPA: nucleoside hydrolase [Bacteroidales bacterium]|nr:nucleoside hydrolase [Bacteroidales bacterium]
MNHLKMILLSYVFLMVQQVCLSVEPVPLQRVIIDTDCAIDDFHAISFLLSQPEIEISAIIVSEGTLKPEDGVVKINSLLKEWDIDTIPVICHSSTISNIPPWRKLNQQLKWGRSDDDAQCDDYSRILKTLFENTEKRTYSLVCLGSLSAANDMSDNYPQYVGQIKRIVWYASSAQPLRGFNYQCDSTAADKILSSNKIRIDIISNLDNETRVFDERLTEALNEHDSQLSRIIGWFHQQPVMMENEHCKNACLKDELVAVYILNPELFDMNVNPSDLWIRYNESYNLPAIREVITDLLTGTYRLNKNVVFNEFPADRKMFNYDIRQIMDSAIARYGSDEWKACVITDEFHGHLGVFSIVGAKMGIKAREILNAKPDELTVVSYAGTVPPYSCLNDGIQVSTGATLGQGTISLASDTLNRPEATFILRNKSVRIRLKEEYLNIINKDIQEGIVKFGLMDDGYWKLVRHSALKYWLDWDRNNIFEFAY